MKKSSGSCSSNAWRVQTAKALGIDFQVTPKIQLEDGIHAARLLLPRCWFDEEKTQVGREALQHYRRDYNTRLKEFTAIPSTTGRATGRTPVSATRC